MKLLRCLMILTVALSAAGVCPGVGVCADQEQGEHLFAAKPAVRTVTLTAFTRARTEMTLVSEVSARCVEVLADVGDDIGENGVFARLDDTFVRLDLDANLVEQEKLKSRVAYLEKEVGRYRDLASREHVSQSVLDKLEQDLDQARLALDGLKTACAALREKLARHTVRAPRGWTVIERSVEPGEWVSPGTPLARLGDYSQLVVPFALSPEEYDRVISQNPLVLNLSETGRKVSARILRTDPTFDPQTRKIGVDLVVTEKLPRQRGGVRVELAIVLPDPSGAVLVPEYALEERFEEFWLTRENGDQVRVVKLGPGPGSTVRVLSPEVSPGDRFKTRR